MKWNKNNVNPMGARPTFANSAEKLQWLNVAIELCCNYPDQGMQILGACLIRERNTLKKEVGNV